MEDTPPKLGVAKWQTKAGYTFSSITTPEWTPKQSLLETIFMFCLNQKARRKDTVLESIEFEGRNIFYYYFGDRLENPTILIFEGKQKGIRHILTSFAIKRRREKKREIDIPYWKGMEKNIRELLNSKKMRVVHTLSYYPISFLYLTLLKQGALYWSELLEISERLKPIPSSVDIREYLLLLNGINLVGYKSAKGEVREQIFPRKVIVPKRKIAQGRQNLADDDLFQNAINEPRKEKKTILSKNIEKEAKELTFTASLLFQSQTRSLFSKIESKRVLTYTEGMNNIGKKVLTKLIKKKYLIKKEGKIFPRFTPRLVYVP